MRRAPGPGSTVPCNNDLLAGNFIDDGERVWLIDYEYCGNNDAAFELGNTATECEFPPERVEAYAEAYYGAPTRGDVARVRLGALRSAYGWALWGFIQAAIEPARLRLPRLGHAPLREGGPHLHLRRLRRGCSDARPPVTEPCPSAPASSCIGGGVIGCSTAYHLDELGWTDVLLLEQGHLSGGTTWHAAGLVGPLRATESGTRLVQYSAELYDRLEAETGLATGYRNVGGVIVARTEDRMVQLRRTAANAAAYDLECRMLTPDEAGELWPPMRVDDLLGAIHLPGRRQGQPDRPHPVAGQGRPAGRRRGSARACASPACSPRTGRAGRGSPASAPTPATSRPRWSSTAPGQWAKAVAELAAGVPADRAAAQRRALLRRHRGDRRACTRTCRSCATRTAGPTSRRRSAAWWSAASSPTPSRGSRPDRIPHPFEFQLLEEDWEHFSVLMEQALVPGAGAGGRPGSASSTTVPRASRRTTSSCSARCRGCAASSSARASTRSASRRPAARAGRWRSGSVAGEPTSDLVGVDVRRFAPYAADNDWLRSRVAEVLGLALRGPVAAARAAHRPRRAALAAARAAGRGRGVVRLADGVGAAATSFAAATATRAPTTWDQAGLAALASVAEQRACRTAVAVFDQTSFSKYVVRGPGALEALQWICAADVDVPVDALRLHAVPQRARHLRGRPDGDPRRRRRVLAGQQLGDDGARPGLARAARLRAGRDRVHGRGPHRPALGARRDGAALARAAGGR